MAINWAKKLEEAGDSRSQKPEGKDWFTAHDLRKETGLSNNNAYEFIKSHIASGKMEKLKGSEYSKEHNQLVRRVWYRFL